MPLTDAQIQAAYIRYYVDLEPITSVASEYGVSRQAIYKAFKRSGYITPKHSQQYTLCKRCGKPTPPTTRAQLRRKRDKGVFCSIACYHASVEERQPVGIYIPNRQAQRIARVVAGQMVHHLQPGNVVHHINRDTTYNSVYNLMVFDSQASHMSHHKGGGALPLWDGSKVLAG